MTTNNGFRCSTAVGYLNKATRICNEIKLDVLTGYNANRVLFEENEARSSCAAEGRKYTAVGIEISEHKKKFTGLHQWLRDKIKFLNGDTNAPKTFNVFLKKGTCLKLLINYDISNIK